MIAQEKTKEELLDELAQVMPAGSGIGTTREPVQTARTNFAGNGIINEAHSKLGTIIPKQS